MSGTPGDADDPDLLAGEYVLGVLDAEEMQAVRARARREPLLARAVADWQGRLAPLVGVIGDVPPPAQLWPRIETAVAPLPQLPANDMGLGYERAPAAPSRAAGAPGRAPRKAGYWPWATAASLALAAALAVVAFLPRPAPPGEVASIAPIGAPAAAFLAHTQADGSVTLSSIAPKPVPTDHDLELWILPVGAQKVAPLGVVPSAGETLRLKTPPPTGTQLLISLEPKGGSPTGQPTGPVLYGGTLTPI
jgi:anti-sigma-K factor RskA